MKRKTKTLLIASVIIVALIVILSSSLIFLEKPLKSGKKEVQIRSYNEEVQIHDIKIGYRGHLFYLPAYVAYAKGYYQEQGLNAELVEFDSTNQLAESILAGKLDAGVGGINAIVILTIEQKSPDSFKIFGQAHFPDTFDALLVAKDSDIESVKDLKGKTISSMPGTAASVWMDMMLEKEKIKDDVIVVQTKPSQQLNALSSGSVDAVFVLEPSIAIGEEKGLSRTLIKSPISRYYKKDMLFTASVFSTKFADDNPVVAGKIVKAVDKAVDFINANPEEAKQYYSDFTPTDDDVEKRLPVPSYIGSQSLEKEEFQRLSDLFTETGILEGNVDVDAMFLFS